jgi:hypothetical protein
MEPVVACIGFPLAGEIPRIRLHGIRYALPRTAGYSASLCRLGPSHLERRPMKDSLSRTEADAFLSLAPGQRFAAEDGTGRCWHGDR